ncbi:hypothetical protein CSKR_111582 [Clonorchis sinensis]|uniref:Uncharacterized protein n=1 Tax=Clonorchis sinensis TaxID=79923 RepID=A0A419PHP0_CLOSI|nr:hypothetical protein CSKR_111582 [Clonorchis sinensis]
MSSMIILPKHFSKYRRIHEYAIGMLKSGTIIKILMVTPVPHRWCSEGKTPGILVETPFRCLTAMPPEESTGAEMLPGYPSLDKGSREEEVRLEPRTFRYREAEQGSKTLICISFTKLNIHPLLERVFLNFSGYSLTVTQMQANATKRLHKFLNSSYFSRDAKRIYEKTYYSHASSVVSTVTLVGRASCSKPKPTFYVFPPRFGISKETNTSSIQQTEIYVEFAKTSLSKL